MCSFSPLDRTPATAWPWLLVVLGAALAAALTGHSALAQDDRSAPSQMPDFSRFTLYEPRPEAPSASFSDGAGVRRVLADFSGRLVLLNFWATWCGPCVDELPSLDRLQGLRDDALHVVAVSVDRGGPATIERFFDRLGIKNLEVFQDRGSALSRAFDVRLYPSTFLIDRDGRIIAALPGTAAEWDSPEALALLDALAAEGKGDGAPPQDLKAADTGLR